MHTKFKENRSSRFVFGNQHAHENLYIKSMGQYEFYNLCQSHSPLKIIGNNIEFKVSKIDLTKLIILTLLIYFPYSTIKRKITKSNCIKYLRRCVLLVQTIT